MDPSRTKQKAVALVIIVFLLGVAIGTLGTYWMGGRVWGARAHVDKPFDRRTGMLDRMTREVELTPDQQKRVDAILADMQEKYEAFHKQIAPQTDQVRQQGREQIRALLTVEQKPKFEEFVRRLDEERRERRKKNGR